MQVDKETVLKGKLYGYRKDASKLAHELVEGQDLGKIASKLCIKEATLVDKIRRGRFGLDEILMIADICHKDVSLSEKHPDLRD